MQTFYGQFEGYVRLDSRFVPILLLNCALLQSICESVTRLRRLPRSSDGKRLVRRGICPNQPVLPTCAAPP
jgi:hypothetical protein